MLRNATEQPHISLQGLTDWESGAKSAGQGIAAMVQGGARMVQERAEVAATGQLAAFSETLRSIEEETRRELQEIEPEDWDYAWQAANAPRVSAAIAELPVPLREQARHIAAAFTREAGIRAWRDRELAGIDKAREQWQHQVEAAVSAGDGAAARHWVQQGRGVFVPETRVEAEERAVESRARLRHWQQRLQQSPVQTLGDYLQSPHKELPRRREEAELLKQQVEATRLQTRRHFADELQERVLQGCPLPTDEWKLAQRAGLISPEQFAASQSPAQEPSRREYNSWFRRIDECDADEERLLDMRLDICAASMPQQERAKLLQRLAQAQSVRQEDRQAMSRRLWDLYYDGAFGCPGDAPAEQRLHRLQKSGLPLLADAGNEAVAQWLESLDHQDEQWISFTSQHA